MPKSPDLRDLISALVERVSAPAVDLVALSAPFPPSAVSWRVGSTTQDKKRGLPLAYIDARDVADRLDEVCGPAGWQCRYTHVGAHTCCEISIRIDGEWITKADGAGETDFEAEKGAFSDSFKRAAVRFGIGRYLYGIKAPWVAIESAGKSYKIAVDEYPKLYKLLPDVVDADGVVKDSAVAVPDNGGADGREDSRVAVIVSDNGTAASDKTASSNGVLRRQLSDSIAHERRVAHPPHDERNIPIAQVIWDDLESKKIGRADIEPFTKQANGATYWKLTAIQAAMRALDSDLARVTEVDEIFGLRRSYRAALYAAAVAEPNFFYGSGDVPGAKKRLADREAELMKAEPAFV